MAKYDNKEKQLKFKQDVLDFQQALGHLGFKPRSSTLLETVPAGRLDEFFVAPWMLSFDPAVAVKGTSCLTKNNNLNVKFREARPSPKGGFPKVYLLVGFS